jgi:hypothetical protein
MSAWIAFAAAMPEVQPLQRSFFNLAIAYARWTRREQNPDASSGEQSRLLDQPAEPSPALRESIHSAQ